MGLRDFWRKEAEKIKDKSAALGGMQNILNTDHVLGREQATQTALVDDGKFVLTRNMTGVYYVDKSLFEGEKPRIIGSLGQSFVSDIPGVLVVIEPEYFFEKFILYALQKKGGSPIQQIVIKQLNHLLYTFYKSIKGSAWRNSDFERIKQWVVEATGVNPMEEAAFHMSIYNHSAGAPNEHACSCYDISGFFNFYDCAARTHPAPTVRAEKDNEYFVSPNDKKERSSTYSVNNRDTRILYCETCATFQAKKYNILTLSNSYINVGDVNSSSGNSPKIHTHTIDHTYLVTKFVVTQLLTEPTNPATGGIEQKWKDKKWYVMINYPYTMSMAAAERYAPKMQVPADVEVDDIKYNPLYEHGPSGLDRQGLIASIDREAVLFILEVAEDPRTLEVNPILVLYGNNRKSYFQILIPLLI